MRHGRTPARSTLENERIYGKKFPAAVSQMPPIDLTDEEGAALADVAREYVRTQRYALAKAGRLSQRC
jgi:hypothetical protein